MDLTIAVCTYGTSEWKTKGDYAMSTIVPAITQSNLSCETIRVHLPYGRLHQARNEALEGASGQSMLWIDGDDFISPGSDFLPTLGRHLGSATVLVPRIRYWRGSSPLGQGEYPRVAGHSHLCEPECLVLGNYVIIGAPVLTRAAKRVGGFREFECYEDWDLWLRLKRIGASFKYVAATYDAQFRSISRNRRLPVEIKNKVHHAILASQD